MVVTATSSSISQSIVLVGALIAASGCATGSAAGQKASTSEPANRGLSRLLAAADIYGGRVAQRQDAEATVVVVFASWCGPCRRELAMLGELRDESPALQVIGLNAYEEWNDHSDEARLRSFLAESAPWLQVVRAEDGMLEDFGGVPKIPSLFVYDRGGRLIADFRAHVRRPPSKSELLDAIASARR